MADGTKTLSEKLHDRLTAISGFHGHLQAKTETMERLAGELQALSEICEQKIHADTKDRLLRVIGKLEKNEDVGHLEKDLIRTWIVGDADAFRKMETNYITWMAELKHAVDKLSRAKLHEVGLKEMLEIDARAKMAQCLILDILMYIGQRDKAEHFEHDMADWSKETKAQIAGILRSELSRYEASESVPDTAG